jgi:hypothetical protein
MCNNTTTEPPDIILLRAKKSAEADFLSTYL